MRQLGRKLAFFLLAAICQTADTNRVQADGLKAQLVDERGDDLIAKALKMTRPATGPFRRTRFADVFFFTNRNLSDESSRNFLDQKIKDFDRLFDNYSGEARFGIASVEYPADRKSGAPDDSARSEEENPFKDFSVISVQRYTGTKEFVDSLAIAGGHTTNAAIYVHGLNNTFSDSIKGALQLQIDLDRSYVIAFSWPSNLDYFAAVDELARSKGYLPFVVGYVRMAVFYRPDLISHSLGGRLTFEAYTDLLNSNNRYFADEDYRFGRSVFAAPDLETSLFRQRDKRLDDFMGTITVYCANDWALRLSRFVNREERLGFCPDNPTGDATSRMIRVDGPMVDKYRHSYFLGSPDMVTSMKKALDINANKNGISFQEELHLH